MIKNFYWRNNHFNCPG